MSSFVLVIIATLCQTSLWISLSSAWPPIRLHGDALDSHWLFERVPFVVMDAAAHVWDDVFRHGTCVPDVTARILG